MSKLDEHPTVAAVRRRPASTERIRMACCDELVGVWRRGESGGVSGEGELVGREGGEGGRERGTKGTLRFECVCRYRLRRKKKEG